MSSPPPKPSYKLIYFVPPSHLQTTKTALLSLPNVGTYPPYTNVCFETTGTSQFKPGREAEPHTGEPGKMEVTEEVRVEVRCLGRDVVVKALEELGRTHPYEVPVYEVYKMEDF